MSDEAKSESETESEAKAESEAKTDTESEKGSEGSEETEAVGTPVDEKTSAGPAKDEEKDVAAETRASVLDMARGEVNEEDLAVLEVAINSIDFATRKGTPEVIGRLESLYTRLGSVLQQIRDGERTPQAEREPLSEEAFQIVQNLVDQGVSAGECGNLEEARGYLEEAIQLHPDGVDCLFNLGVVYGLLAHHNIAKMEFYDNYVRDEVFIERAKICYDHLLEIEPDHIASLNNLATLYSIRGNQDESIPLLQRIVGLEPKSDDEKSLVERAKAQLEELESI